MRAVGLIVLLGTCGAIGAFVPAEEAAIRKRIATMSVLQKGKGVSLNYFDRAYSYSQRANWTCTVARTCLMATVPWM